MAFQKGHKINIGRQCTAETRERIRIANVGKKLSIETKKKISENNAKIWLGKKRGQHTEESRRKMSIANLGKVPWNKGLKGFMSGENHHWFGQKKYGEKNPKWKGGVEFWKKDDRRNDSGYQGWTISVRERDGYKCRIDNKSCGGRLEVHHILSWREFPELRYKINNGITLCHAHHPRKRAEEKRLSPYFQDLVSVSNELI